MGPSAFAPTLLSHVLRRIAIALTGVALVGALAAVALGAASPAGTWKLDGETWKYRWVALAGGGWEETSLTRHLTPTNKCLVKPLQVVYRYRPLADGLFREEQFTWRKDCTTYWDTNHDTLRIEVTATRMKAYCDKPYRKVCWSYTRVDATPPHVRALASTGKVGGDTVLRYLVNDASGRTWEILTIYRGGVPAQRYRTTLGPAKAGRIYAYRLRHTPSSFRGAFRFCVESHDAAGNVSEPSCAVVTIST